MRAERRRQQSLLRWEEDRTVVRPAVLESARFHAFLSQCVEPASHPHLSPTLSVVLLVRSNWASGQDQARSLKQLMQALVPGLKVWLDVDDGNRSMQEQKSDRPPPQTLEEKYQRAVEIVDSVVVSSWLWYTQGNRYT